jgi:hypothetical protein
VYLLSTVTIDEDGLGGGTAAKTGAHEQMPVLVRCTWTWSQCEVLIDPSGL